MEGFTPTSDLKELHSTMRAIEQACTSIQMHINPGASEAVILSLGQSSQPYKTCQFILENSQVATARFQAAAAIREAAIREWVVLSIDVKRNLICFCLLYIMQHASSPDGYVQAKVASVASQLMKRGWLEFMVGEKVVFFYQVNKAIVGADGIDMQFAGIKFLESLLSEFSPSTSSAMGLPREFHEQCRRSFEREYLKTFYQWTQEAALSVTNQIIESDSAVPEVKVCTAALDLMLQILNWDFRSNNSDTKLNVNVFSSGVRQDGDSLKKSECHVVQPGSEWRDVLVLSGHVGWLLSLYAALRLKFSREGYWIDCPVAVSARKLVVQFCSLTGPVFLSDDRKMHEQHLLQLLSGIIEWVDPPDAVLKAIENGKSDSEMLDGCRALLAIANVTTPHDFDGLLKSMRPMGTLTFLSMLMSEVIKVLMTSNTEEETWSWEARDVLLDTWTAILTPINTMNVNALLPPDGITAAANLFSFIVECELRLASATAFNDEGDSDYLHASVSAMDERLSCYALIARASIDVTIPLLLRVFSERVARLNQGRGIIDLTETLEELYSLLLIIGHVIADEGEGELPLVPNTIQTQFVVDFVEADRHPVILLSSSIIKFAEQCLSPEMRASVFSPRLMESIIWFLARWSRTYLMSSDGIAEKILDSGHHHEHSSKKTLLCFFGEHNQGKLVLDIIVRIAFITLTSYPGEKDLQGLTCYQLLHSLVQQKHICIHLVTLNSWHELATSFSTEKTLMLLDTAHQRSLAQTLVRSASGIRNSEASSQYVRNLMGPIATYIVEISRKHNFRSIAQQPDILLSVSCMLERLRGAASASEPRTQKAIYELGFSVMNPILILLEVYKHESAVVYLLLKFVVDWVDGQITYLEAQETAAVVDFCMRLLQLYSSHNIGKISLSLSISLISESKTDKYRDLRALLQLLSSLCSKDMIDFSSDSIEAQGTNISQVVYYGLHMVAPLISMELLKYPKLCHDYFSLLSHMLEVYPETFALLNSEAFAHVLGTLDFGLHHQDADVVSMSLRALQALASYHYKETGNGNIGLGAHTTGLKDSSGNVQEGLLSRFLRSLLQLLLFEDYSSDLISVAADALLPLILCEQGLYQRLGNELIERQPNPTLKTRLANAFHTLTSANQLSSSLDRINYQRFRKNLTSFLVEVRGFLRTM
ncbi:exportin-4 isoform X1 [Vigna radiata var. radiata]|uniref:Exportin-4 n=2 Tax=Vigna radiata var. radiata TaxID=3916 RepID=A0A1S3TCS0_VIGRR|nr:exportin-4 isoform X1 [Vigna radiata var. radiata]XP_014491562.1 exportin-4 isoform X1 [Vigna radiata var. radiata]XP_014491563.1 exportin-4 isoform X1 [Vigna radiata var. radiata]